MMIKGWCYECSFWQNMYDKHKDDPGWIRIDGESWVLKPMVENVPRGWNSLGCGGRKMYVNIEGKGIVASNNCWCQGDVSDAFKDLMPDNATWATKEEFDKAPVVGYIMNGVGLVFTDRVHFFYKSINYSLLKVTIMKTSKENGQQELNRLIKMREICKEKLKNYDSPHDRKLLDSINDLIAKKATS